MGTKFNPGKFDCYSRAFPEEPMFVLLARDPAAPRAIRLWVNTRIHLGKNVPGDDQIKEAIACADAMEAWRLSRPILDLPKDDGGPYRVESDDALGYHLVLDRFGSCCVKSKSLREANRVATALNMIEGVRTLLEVQKEIQVRLRHEERCRGGCERSAIPGSAYCADCLNASRDAIAKERDELEGALADLREVLGRVAEKLDDEAARRAAIDAYEAAGEFLGPPPLVEAAKVSDNDNQTE